MDPRGITLRVEGVEFRIGALSCIQMGSSLNNGPGLGRQDSRARFLEGH